MPALSCSPLGSTYRRLNIPGEEELIGAGVHFCATCDGAFYRGRDVLVVGGGNSAGEESILLTRFAKKVTIVTCGPQLSGSRVVAEKVAENPAIEVLTSTTPVELRGDSRLRSVVVADAEGHRRERPVLFALGRGAARWSDPFTAAEVVPSIVATSGSVKPTTS